MQKPTAPLSSEPSGTPSEEQPASKKSSGSGLHAKVSVPLGCLVFFLFFLGLWWVFETRAEKTVLSGQCRVLRDPDHRLPASNQRLGTNSDSLRCALEAEDIPPEAHVVFFLGDSFVYGVQLKAEQALPSQFQQRIEARYPEEEIFVVNAGWESSSPLLGLRLLKEIGEKYHPDLVLYGFDMTDFRDDLLYRNLLKPRGLYRAVHLVPATLWFANNLCRSYLGERSYRKLFRLPSERFFCVRHPLEKTRPDMIPVWESLVAMDTFCRSRLHADFRLLVFPRGFQYSRFESPENWEAAEYSPMGPWVLEPFRFFREMGEQSSIKIHSLLPAFRETTVYPTCFHGDPHWTPAGVGVAAEDLEKTAWKEDWFGLNSEPSH